MAAARPDHARDRIHLAERVNRVIETAAARDDGARLGTQPSTHDDARAASLTRKGVSTSLDTSMHQSAVRAQPQRADAKATDIDTLSRRWQSLVGAKAAATSRPVGVVDNLLIIEMTPDSQLNGVQMARAVAALGRDDVDRVAVRVVNALPDRQAQIQAQRQGIRR